MGGAYQHKTFGTLEGLLEYVREQIETANDVGLYLLEGRIKQIESPMGSFEWSAYFSK